MAGQGPHAPSSSYPIQFPPIPPNPTVQALDGYFPPSVGTSDTGNCSLFSPSSSFPALLTTSILTSRLVRRPSAQTHTMEA